MQLDAPVGTWRRAVRAAWAAPLALLYRVAVSLRHLAYDVGLRRSYVAPLRVISIGGLEAGGSGKTPLAGFVLQALVEAGWRPGLLTRGYRRTQRGLALRLPGEAADAAALGDEAAMLVATGLDVAVAACADRRRGAAALAAAGCNVAVMDDGFVHRRLRRDVDVVVLRAQAPFGDGRPLPWGSLREMPNALRRAHVVCLYGGAGPDDAAALAPERRAQLARLVATAVWPRPVCDVCDVCDVAPPAPARAKIGVADPAPLHLGWAHARLRAGVPLAGLRAVAAAGTARPDAFFRALAEAGAELAAAAAYADHHPFSPGDVRHLVALATRHRATAVAVTAKDFVKLAPLWPPGAAPLLPVALQLLAELPPWVTAPTAAAGQDLPR